MLSHAPKPRVLQDEVDANAGTGCAMRLAPEGAFKPK